MADLGWADVQHQSLLISPELVTGLSSSSLAAMLKSAAMVRGDSLRTWRYRIHLFVFMIDVKVLDGVPVYHIIRDEAIAPVPGTDGVYGNEVDAWQDCT